MTLKSDHVHDSATARLQATSYTSVLPPPTASVNNSPMQTTATSAFRHHDMRAHFIADTHSHQESTLSSARNAYATPAPAAAQEKLNVNVHSQQQLLIANPHEPQSQVHHDAHAEIRSSYPTNFAQHDRENAPVTTTETEAGRQASSAPVVANEDHEMYAHDDHNHDTNNNSAKTHVAHTRQQEQQEQEQQRGIEMDVQENLAYSANADSEMRMQREEDEEEQTHAISHKSTHVDHSLQMHHHQDTEASRDFATDTAATELRQDSVRERENVLAHGQEHREGEDNMHTEHMHSSVTSRAEHDVYLGQGGQATASESVHAEHVDSNAPRIHNDTDDNIVDQSIAAAHSGMAAVSDADAQAAQDPLAQRMDETTSNATPQLDPDNTMSDDQLRDVPSSQHEASAEIVHNDEQDQDEHAPHHALAAHPEEGALHTPPASVSVHREQEAHDSNAMVEDGTTTAGMQDDRTRSRQAFDDHDHDHDMSSHQPGDDAGAEVARALQTEASVFRAKDVGNQVTSLSPMQKNAGVQEDMPTTHHEGSEMLTGSPKSKRPRLSLGLHKSPAVLARGESISLARRAAATAKKRRDEARAELERNGVRENMETAMERIVGSSASTRANVSQNKGKRLARVKWREEEVIALKRGVEKYGVGRWAVILREFANDFDPVRISVDLKDKWRNIYKIPKIRNVNPDLADAMLPASENGESALDEQVQTDRVFDRGAETSQHGENAAVASDPAASHEVTEAERDGQNSQPETQASQHMASEMSQSSPATREGVSSTQQEIGRASRDRTSTSQDLEDEMINDEQRRMLPANHGSLLAQSSETRSYDDSHKRTREEMIRTENVQDRTIGTDEHVHVAAPAESVSTVAADNNSAIDRHTGDRAMGREVHELEGGQHSAHDADAHDPLKEQLDAPVQTGIDSVQSIDQNQDFGHQVDQALDQRTSRQTQTDFTGKTTHILEEASAEASANFSALGE